MKFDPKDRLRYADHRCGLEVLSPFFGEGTIVEVEQLRLLIRYQADEEAKWAPREGAILFNARH